MTNPLPPLSVFISYARQDAMHLKRLETQLTPLIREGWIQPAADQYLRVGDRMERIILDRLRSARLILLLISPDFVASKWIPETEIKNAADRHARGDVRIVPILLRPTLLAGTPFEELQPLPGNRKPLTSWPDQDLAWMNVLEGLRSVVEELLAHQDAVPSQDVIEQPNRNSAREFNGEQRKRPPTKVAQQANGNRVREAGTGRQATAVTLLHLSDLHFGQDRGGATARFDQQEIIARLLEDIERVKEQVGAPDYVLVTGDVAFSGRPKEYEMAGAWLENLCSAASVTPERILMIPGNHDVNREQATGSHTTQTIRQSLRISPEKLDDVLLPNNHSQLQATLWPKLEAYAHFARAFGAPVISPASPWWTLSIKTALGPLVVLGLNTCLLSFDGNDGPNTLALGTGQLTRAFEGLSENHLLLAMMHHPPGWLRDGEELLRRIQRFPHILWCGHVHEQGAIIASPLHRGGSVQFVSGAGHESVQEGGRHGYAWVRLRPEGIDFFPRFWNRDRHTFQAERNVFGKLDEDDKVRIKSGKLPDKLERWLEPSSVALSDNTSSQCSPDPRALTTHLGPADRVLVVNYQGLMPPPEGFRSWEELPCEGVQICAAEAESRVPSRLREPRLAQSTWTRVLEEISVAVKSVCKELKGRLHVFASAPHALGAWLGRCLDDNARIAPIFIYQFDFSSKKWVLFSGQPLHAEKARFFESLQQLPASSGRPQGKGVLLSIEVAQSADDPMLEAAREFADAGLAYRLSPADPQQRFLIDLPTIENALENARITLDGLRRDHPGEPIHLLTSAPLAFVIELGRWLRPSVYGQVVIHMFDARRARYYPVLEVITGKISAGIDTGSFRCFEGDSAGFEGLQ